MRIIETKTAPNARRVRVFLAEKGINMEYHQVDIERGDNLSEDFRDKNIMAKVPVLELDNGDYIGESVAICRYFEALQPAPALMGVGAQAQAEVEMWHRRIEWYLFLPIAMCFQHSTGYFKDRMTPVAEWGKVNRSATWDFLPLLEQRLQHSQYIASDTFSIADIAAMCAIDFARVVDIRPSRQEFPNLCRWLESVHNRPSAKA